MTYPRDMRGYGATPPDANWPGSARIAVQIIVAYEEGSENSILHGDPAAEAYVSDLVEAVPLYGQRNPRIESLFEYGTRAGFWRLMRLFEEYKINVTVLANGMALERCPEAAAAMAEAGHEVASHGWRWIDYTYVGEDVEREHMRLTIDTIARLTGQRPLGWYTGRVSPQTRRLVVEEGGFLYDADSYCDDLPYWVKVSDTDHLVVPYAFDSNDMRFVTASGFSEGEQFYTYLKDSFDFLYAEGETKPKMMSVGLHCRISGRPGRCTGFKKFLDHVQGHDKVWITTRLDIARHWREHHPAT